MKFQATLCLVLVSVASSAEAAVKAQQPLSLKEGSFQSEHLIDPRIYQALESFADPVEALIHLRPELEAEVLEPRLLQIAGRKEPEWLLEGDKLRLRQEGLKFTDLTEHWDTGIFDQIAEPVKAHLPPIDSETLVRDCLKGIDVGRMREVLQHMTSYHDRYYNSIHGEESQRWLHDYIAKIISDSPLRSYISLEYHTHKFNQPSIIARFEPPIRNASLPLTILGAHADSANYLFPLLPAPGADDDMSGSVTILEAFTILAKKGFIPQNGPVEFHWYAAEEAGLLGSQDVVAYKKGQGATIGAMLHFDLTAFIRQNATERVYLIVDETHEDLTKWAIDVGRHYVDCPVEPARLIVPSGGSDHMSWHRAGYPAIFATEGDPMAGGVPGELNPYVHGSNDVMTVDDDKGVFSFEHMARFTQLAIAFAIEQAGWSKQHSVPG